jgi:hypothetical protein
VVVCLFVCGCLWLFVVVCGCLFVVVCLWLFVVVCLWLFVCGGCGCCCRCSSQTLIIFYSFFLIQVLATSRLLEDRENKLALAQDQIMELTKTNATLQIRIKQPITPTLTRISALEMKLIAMDDKYKQREMDLQNVVEDVTQRSRQEIAMMQRKNDIIIANKNSEIQRFRMELDALLNAVKNAKKTRHASP